MQDNRKNRQLYDELYRVCVDMPVVSAKEVYTRLEKICTEIKKQIKEENKKEESKEESKENKEI